jgi:hypothetical protein
VCCAHIPVLGGTVTDCNTGTLTVACTTSADCVTNLGTSCTAGSTEVVQLCAQTADCANAGTASQKCCTFTQDGGALSFCTNGIVAGLGGGTCM